jgi:hypothetical protein
LLPAGVILLSKINRYFVADFRMTSVQSVGAEFDSRGPTKNQKTAYMIIHVGRFLFMLFGTLLAGNNLRHNPDDLPIH